MNAKEAKKLTKEAEIKILKDNEELIQKILTDIFSKIKCAANNGYNYLEYSLEQNAPGKFYIERVFISTQIKMILLKNDFRICGPESALSLNIFWCD